MLHIYKKIKAVIILLLIGCCAMGVGCNVINPAEPVPTYIHIDSFHFVQNDLVHPNTIVNNTPVQALSQLLSLGHQTNIAWVYYNNNPIGIFDLPVTFPVVTNGTGVLEVSPGIIADGENNDVVNYTFYTVDTFSFVPQPGKTLYHTPQITYSGGDDVTIIDNFESGNNTNRFVPWEGSPGGVIITQPGDSTFEGLHSGMIALNTLSGVDSSIDSTNFTFPIPSGMAYIEFEYNSTIPFYVGLQGNLGNLIYSTPVFLTGIYPNTGWQKFYLEVDGFSASAQASSYNFYLKAVLAPGQTSGRLLIDNIQLVTAN